MKKNRILHLAVLALIAALLAGCAAPAQQTETEAVGAGTELTVYCFQAGKADAFLLYTENSAVLIDTGESGFGKTILACLEAHGIEKLDYLVITHFDKDHVGGAKKILESVEVGTVLQSNCPKDASAYNKYITALEALGMEAVTVREDLTFTLDSVVYTVNPPAQETYASDASNNSSLIVSVTNGQNRLLFTGDAQDARIAEFLETNPGACDFLKVPYHGHWQTALASLIKTVSPSCAVITSSDDEPEDEQTLDLLAQLGVEAFLTRTGAVVVHTDGTTLRAEYSDG